MAYEEATQGHASAQINSPATRNPDAERGVGRAFRYEPDMLPRRSATVSTQKAGMSSIRASRQGPAVEVRKDLTGRPGSLTVAVRSGNVDPQAIGINKTNWGIAGDGTPGLAASVAPTQSKLFLVGGLAALAAFFLLSKKG